MPGCGEFGGVCYRSITYPHPEVPCLKGAFEQKPKGSEGAAAGPCVGRVLQAEGTAGAKALSRRMLVYFRNSKEARVPRAAPAAGGCQEMEFEAEGGRRVTSL